MNLNLGNQRILVPSSFQTLLLSILVSAFLPTFVSFLPSFLPSFQSDFDFIFSREDTTDFIRHVKGIYLPLLFRVLVSTIIGEKRLT